MVEEQQENKNKPRIDDKNDEVSDDKNEEVLK